MEKTLGVMGRKVGMTHIFGSDGTAVPVTVIVAGPCSVMQIKRANTDSYEAIQIGFEQVAENKLNSPEKGHQRKAGHGFFRGLRELRLDAVDGYELGSVIGVEIFAPGEKVRISGTSVGKGTQGVMRRWNFSGLPASHGHEKKHRSPGSIGHNTFPGKVFKGKKMHGHTGARRVTLRNVEIIYVRPDQNMIVVKGAVPGPKNGLLFVRKQTTKP